ncbi:MAG TPA: response regulator transcription factor [Bacteroidota bacterium]|nr:response regulator transcription factor [Bacteroidota bacterium]
MTPQKSILVVDDEQDIVDLVKYNLQREGYTVLTARNGKEALQQAGKNPSLILLDVMMPEMNGLDLLKKLKNDADLRDIPVVFLTAKGSEVDEILGLELGADDYIVKPISIPKLIARIKTVLRKSESQSGSADQQKEFVFGAIEIIPSHHIVRIDKKEVFFPKKEFEILTFLVKHRDQVITRERLLNAIWGQNVYVVDRTIDVHIRKIREKLGPHAEYIETIKGIGYRIRIREEG